MVPHEKIDSRPVSRLPFWRIQVSETLFQQNLDSRYDPISASADLPKASSLCGVCNEVCPVNIPIPDLLLRLRARAKDEHVPSPGTPPMGPWAWLASQPAAWRAALAAGKALDYVPTKLIPVPALQTWMEQRELPPWRGGEFRKWMKERRSGTAR